MLLVSLVVLGVLFQCFFLRLQGSTYGVGGRPLRIPETHQVGGNGGSVLKNFVFTISGIVLLLLLFLFLVLLLLVVLLLSAFFLSSSQPVAEARRVLAGIHLHSIAGRCAKRGSGPSEPCGRMYT